LNIERACLRENRWQSSFHPGCTRVWVQ